MPVLATPGSSQPTDCKHAFYAGVHYSPGSQCVEALATNDVRCYDRTPHDDCTYGAQRRALQLSQCVCP